MKADSPRAASIMSHRQQDERSVSRTALHVAALADCPQTGSLGASALIRDVSNHGVFFFAQFVPELGAEVSLSFCSKPSANSPRVYCRGRVVRVEPFSSGAAGIAIKLDSYRVVAEAAAC